MTQEQSIQIFKTKNDSNGNPRVIVHFLSFLNPWETGKLNFFEQCKLAEYRAKKLGFNKYRGRDFGGGYVIQCFNENEIHNRIMIEKAS